MPPYSIAEELKIAILAIVQGIAEFLPISSSGHLVALNALFGARESETVELGIILHLGTLVAIVVFYRKRIIELLREDKRVIPLLIVGTLPAVFIGLYIKTQHEWLTENALLAGFMLPLTGFMLMLLPLLKKGETEYQQIGLLTALLIGCAQAFAILPGISRSGATIVAGSLLGLKRQSAATFSFLLAIPAIAGASVLQLKDIYDAGGKTTTEPWLLVLGALIAFGVGWVSLAWLVKWIEKGKLHLFAYWVIPLGFLLVVWQLYEYLANVS